MKKIREITIAGMGADPDWVGDETAELDNANALRLSTGWTDVEWVLLYVDGSGNKIGADSGTFNAQVTFKQPANGGARYWRGALQTGIAAGVLQTGDERATGGSTKRPSVLATIRLTGAIASPPAAAVSAEIWAQEV